MKTLAIVSLFVSMASAWWDHGHLLTAKIAQNILEKKDPETLNQVISILETLKIADPAYTTSEDKHPMVECATFADQIKSKGGGWQRGWHFIDEPFLNEGGKIEDYNFTRDTHNITEVIRALKMFHTKETGYKETYEYETIMSHTYKDHSEDNGLSYAMRLLIHYLGDVHQPLHSSTEVNHEHMQGDFGGNLVYLPAKEGATNLHAVWDSVIYEFTGFAKLPFTDDKWNELSGFAQTLQDKYQISDEDANNLDPVKWAHESFLISENVVYPGVKAHQALTQEYLDKAKTVAERQVVLGGNRLANLLMSFKLQGHTSKMTKRHHFMARVHRIFNRVKKMMGF